MSRDTITSVFNDGYIAEVYESYRKTPASVDESWRQFFRFAEGLAGTAGSFDPNTLRIVAGAASLVDAIRSYGHLGVVIDPLGSAPPGAPELTAEFYNITPEDLQAIPGSALGTSDTTAAETVSRLRTSYSSTIGFEYEYMGTSAERQWFREAIEGGEYHKPLSIEDRKAVLRRLTEVDGLERFLGRAYQGYKRFSVEGSDALVPMLDECITQSGRAGARDLVIGMAHRGRINVLAHTLGMPYASVFNEFEGKHAPLPDADATGDVKYHLGYYNERMVDGKAVALTLVPNPSHLEFVNPVMEGIARAKQRTPSGGRDESTVVPVCIHGDSAFIGEGVVAETLNISMLRGFRTGGTIHIIVNNQVGFTTDPVDARSTRYASDLAKGFDIPVMHVNGDNPEAYIQAMRLAVAYRTKFNKDVLIDLVSYRRHGHNETDEPAFTQPGLYQKIRSHKTPREVFAARLVNDGVLSTSDVDAVLKEVTANFEAIHASDRPVVASEGVKAGDPASSTVVAASASTTSTAVAADKLNALNERLLQWPETLRVNSRLVRTLARRREAMGDAGGIDWGHAEVLAFSSLLSDGHSIRLTGQDAQRGTFSHRQAVLHDSESGEVYIPLQNLGDAVGRFDVFNSPLSEAAVLGFEYGYSVEAKDSLVLWEAQYGDFANVAQPIFDQFMSSDRAKWGQESSVAMLLPHGYEGGGPEHSSARLERYLQMCAENNMTVAYPSTPAQYFHILRRQAKLTRRQPLVLMQPKSLLRLPEAASKLADLTGGTFQSVIDDVNVVSKRDGVRRLVFCTGKMYYDLLAQRRDDVALVRVEQLYPWPHDEVARIVDLYPAVQDVVWAQEEPKNMGAWSFVAPRLRGAVGNSIELRYIGRPERASPAEGYASDHNAEQKRIVEEVFALAKPVSGKRAKAVAK